MRKPLFVLAIIFSTAALVSGCGSGSDSAEGAAAASPAAVESTFNAADVAFAQGMVPHHSQAVEMATIALEQSSNPTILDLAGRIQGGQDPEIEQMRGWLATWGQEEMSSDMEGMDMGSDDGMMDTAEMAELAAATGPAFDSLFVDMMIRHHQGAIASANAVLADGSAPEVRALAQAIVAAQEGEIAEMQALSLG